MANRLLAPALVAAAFALTACPPTYPNCNNDEHCSTEGRTEVCVDGKCQECGKDTDCKAGFVCRANKCTPKPECQGDQGCAPGSKCQNEKCVPGCNTDANCPRGQACREGQCAPTAQCASDNDCGAGQKCENGRCVTPQAATGPCELKTVRFEFNESKLTSEAEQVLRSNAQCLKEGKGNVTLEGHADERGTEEYNLHLGEKRANAVKRYLVTLGVDANRLKTVSYGEERPANNASNEAAWAENRRVEFSK
ncbi:MAG: peptidoglycan-associated lipoprotein Pal [Myxococcales bacterium]